MKNVTTYLFLSLLMCGLMLPEAQARGGRYAAVGLGGFAAGTLLGSALAARPVYYDDYGYDDYYGPYPYNAPYYYDDYGYRPYYGYRHDYYWSPDGAPYRPKN